MVNDVREVQDHRQVLELGFDRFREEGRLYRSQFMVPLTLKSHRVENVGFEKWNGIRMS